MILFKHSLPVIALFIAWGCSVSNTTDDPLDMMTPALPELSTCYLEPNQCIDDTQTQSTFVINSLQFPTSETTLNQWSLDIDGNGITDNTLGGLLSTLGNFVPNFDISEQITQSIDDGSLILLNSIQSDSFSSSDNVGFSLYQGFDPDIAPCTDPDDPSTCGQHLRGDASFTAQYPTTVSATIDSGTLIGGPGVLNISIAFGETQESLISFSLVGARVEGTVNEETGTITNGVIAGGILTEQINLILPVFASNVDALLESNCSLSPEEGCCAEEFETERAVISFLDSNNDCTIEADELANNPLITAFLSPDLDLLDADGNFNPNHDQEKDTLSIGLSFSTAPASFDIPEIE